MTWERICLWAAVISFLGAAASLGYAFLAAPAPWTRMVFDISVLLWIVSAAGYYGASRRK